MFSVIFLSCLSATAQNGSGVVVNELMAHNTAFITDENGQYEDWIEIYNTNSFSVDISGFYLSDDVLIPNKWQFPSGTVIAANDYLIVWADQDLDEGPLHADFKLSAAGEEVVFSNFDLVEIDHVSFGQQVVNMSYARVPNGVGDFTIQMPTFAQNNEEPMSILTVDLDHSWSIYPNPCNDYFTLKLGKVTDNSYGQIVDELGRVVLEFNASAIETTIALNHIKNGVYYVVYNESSRKIVIN